MQYSRRGRGKSFNNFRGQTRGRGGRGQQYNMRQQFNDRPRGNYFNRGNRSRQASYSNRGTYYRRGDNHSSYTNTRGSGNFQQRVFYSQPSTSNSNQDTGNETEKSNKVENQFFRA